MLTEEVVKQIREDWLNGAKIPELNEKYGFFTNKIVRNLSYHDPEYNPGSRKSGAPGERNRHAKLGPNEVVEIRRLYKTGLTYNQIGDMFNISKSTISDIITRRTWKHIEAQDESSVQVGN